ncbi:putative ribonuclease H-like domain-containing protein [Tanacetum coccineum]
MAEYSQKWYNRTSRGRSTETSNGLAAIQAQLNNLGREIKKVNENVYVAQVGCEQCKGPHYTKDCPLKEDKTLEEAYYTQFSRPFQGGGYRATTPGRCHKEPRSIDQNFINSNRANEQADSNSIRRIGSNQYVVYTGQNNIPLYKSRQMTVPFPSCLDNHYCEEEGNYGPKFTKAYGASHINNAITRKEKDPSSFTLPCFINDFCFDNALVDLGASVSVMSLSTYLNLGLDMPEDIRVPLILERPFLSTARAKIDVYKRKITLRVWEEKIVFTSVKSTSSIIKRVYMLSLREQMELDLEARLMGETLVLNRSLDPFLEDYIELNDLNESFELRRNQGDDLIPTIEEGEVIEEFRIRNEDLDTGIDDYPSYCDDDNKIHIDCAHNLKFSCMIGFEFTHANFLPLLVLVIKPHTKIPYELICGRTPLIDFMKSFGCPVTILNTRDNLGKFDGKADEGFFVGYFMVSKAMRVFNKRTRIVEETLIIRFLENAPNLTGNGPDWLFDVDSLSKSMNYVPVVAGNQTNGISGTRDNIVAGQAEKKIEPEQEYILIPFCTTDPLISQGPKDSEEDVGMKPTEVNESEASNKGEEDEQDTRSEFERLLQQAKQTNSTNSFNTVGTPVSAAEPSSTNDAPSSPVNAAKTSEEHLFEQFSPFKNAFTLPDVPNVSPMDDNTGIFTGAYDDENVGAEADLNNLETTMNVSPIPTTRINKYHPKDQIIGDLNSAIQTRRMTMISDEHAMVSYINKQRRTNHKDYQNCLFACFLSQKEPKKVIQALEDPSWIEAMQEELLQFELQNVWTLVDLPNGKRAIGTKWVIRNKKDERGIVVRNKARLVAQGYTQEEDIDYDEVFAPVARIEAIRLFLAYASYMGFIVYQMDVKSAFLYGTIEEEVYVCQPPGFEDPYFPDKVYKVEKALYGLHQAPRAWYETLSTYLLGNIFRRGTIDKTLFIKKDKSDILLVQVYVDDIIFGSTKKTLCLQVQQKEDGIFISQDKYVADILKKFDFVTMKTASTPMEPNKALVKDEDANNVDVHLYRSMIRSLMYLTASRPDITFVVCACISFQVTPKFSHLHAVKRIFRYLKGQPKLGLWYPRDSSFDLEAFSDSDYAGASLDKKSKTGGCQFLRRRLISLQCKKQTIVANSTTKAEYAAAANCCGQRLGHPFHQRFFYDWKKLDSSGCQDSPQTTTMYEESSTKALLMLAVVPVSPRVPYWRLQKKLKVGLRLCYPKQSNDPPLSRVNTLGSWEGQHETNGIDDAAQLQSSGTGKGKDDEWRNFSYKALVDKEDTYYFLTIIIQTSKEEVKEGKNRGKGKKSRTPGFKRLRKVGSSSRVESSNDASLGAQEDASKQGRKIADLDVDAEDSDFYYTVSEVVLATVMLKVNYRGSMLKTTTIEEVGLWLTTLIEIKAAKPKAITSAATTTTTTRPKARGCSSRAKLVKGSKTKSKGSSKRAGDELEQERLRSKRVMMIKRRQRRSMKERLTQRTSRLIIGYEMCINTQAHDKSRNKASMKWLNASSDSWMKTLLMIETWRDVDDEQSSLGEGLLGLNDFKMILSSYLLLQITTAWKIFYCQMDKLQEKRIGRTELLTKINFAVLENMNAYRDEGMDDVIFGEPFLREADIKAKRFKGMITLYKGDDEVTYQMVRLHPRFKHHTNEQCNKIPPLLKVNEKDVMNGVSHAYQKLKGFYKGVLNLGPDYIRNVKTEEWLTRGHISVHELEYKGS